MAGRGRGVGVRSGDRRAVAAGSPVNTVAPVVTGTATVGQTLTTTNGTWTGDATIVYTYRWYVNGVSIIGATASTYVLTAYEVGKSVTCLVRGTNGVGTSTAFSNAITGIAALTSTTFVNNGVTLTTAAAYEWSVAINGAIGIIIPSGSGSITARSPAQTTESAVVINGTMKNPQRQTGNPVQGYDARASETYNVSALATYPISVTAGDIVVAAISHPTISLGAANTNVGVIDNFAGFYIITSAWPAGTVPPAANGWSGRGTPVAYQVDLDAIIASWPTYTTSSMSRPTIGTVTAQFNRPELGWGMTDSDADLGYPTWTTNQKQNGGSYNYGQFMAVVNDNAGLWMLSSDASLADRKAILTYFICNGVEIYDSCEGSGLPVANFGGGISQYQFPYVALALAYTGRSASLSTLRTVVAGNQFLQPFVYDATLLSDLTTPHTDYAKPCVSRKRTIPGGGVSGLVITIPTYRSGVTGDPARMNVTTLKIKRVSDGATAIVTTQSTDNITASTSGTITVTIDAHPGSPFVAADEVYFISQDEVRLGDADWTLEGRNDIGASNFINPNYGQTYRGLNFWGGGVALVRSIDIWDADWDAMELYVARANRANDPSATRDFPTHNQAGYSATFVSDFWTAYAPTVIGKAPVFVTSVSVSGTTTVGEVVTAAAGVAAGDATITYAYQWMSDGVDISGETASTYTILIGELGKELSVRKTATNSYGSQTIYSIASAAVDNGYAINAVEFDGTDYAFTSGLTIPGQTKKALIAFSIYYNGSITTARFISALNAGGTAKFQCFSTAAGSLNVYVADSGAGNQWNFQSANGVVVVNTWQTFVLSADNTGGTMTAIKAWKWEAGAWSNAATSAITNFLGADKTWDAFTQTGLSSINGTNQAFTGYLADVYCNFSEYLDISVLGNRDLFLPTVSKGSDGSLPTGTAPGLFYSGATGSWHTNKGTGGGVTLTGTLTTAPSAPT